MFLVMVTQVHNNNDQAPKLEKKSIAKCQKLVNMLVTATNELKFHHWPGGMTEESYSLGSTAEIVSLSWSKDNNFMIWLQKKGRPEILTLKDINNIKPIHIITAIDNATSAIFQRKTKRCVSIGTSSSTVALYDTKTKSIVKLFTVPAAVESLDFNSEDEFLAVACQSGVITILNVLDGNEACTYNVGNIPTTLRFHQSLQSIFAVGTSDGSVFVFDIRQSNPIYLMQSHSQRVNSLSFSTKPDTIISAGEDGKFCVHDMKQNACTFRGYLQHAPTSIDISPDGKHMAIGAADGSILIYETKNYLTPLLNWKPHCTRINFLKFSNVLPGDNQSDVQQENSSNHTEVTSATKAREESDFKSLYNKFLNKTDEDETLKVLKDDIIADFRKDADQLNAQMNVHMSNLQEFIKKEFEKMTLQMDDKWDVLNMVSGNYKSSADDISSEPVYDSENPIVLE